MQKDNNKENQTVKIHYVNFTLAIKLGLSLPASLK